MIFINPIVMVMILSGIKTRENQSVFAYLRVSGRRRIERDGFPRQRHAIKEYAERNSIAVAQWFEEKGISGKNDLDNRPALQELMVALLSNGVRTVLIEKLDRLARDLMVQESIIADFQRKGFQIVSVIEPDLCNDDPTRTLMRQILGTFSEYERRMIVTKLRVARQRVKKNTGSCEGRKAYGEHPGEQAVLERMRELRANGLSTAALTRQLNAEGLRTRSGTVWVPATVARILERTA